MRYMKAVILLLAFLILSAPIFAQTVTVYPNGVATVLVPALQYINVFTSGSGVAVVRKLVGGPANNMVARYAIETNGTVSNQETVFGPYTLATTIRIEAGPDPVLYSVSQNAVATPCQQPHAKTAYYQGAPATATVAATLLATDLMSGIIVGTPTATGATVAYTVPTGTLLDTASGLGINDGFEWTVINLAAAAADTITVTAGTGHTLVGSGIVPSAHATTGGVYGNAARFYSRKTAANTFITYRIH